MIVSAVVDPLCFGPGGVFDELTKRGCDFLSHGIIQNGVLLDGPGRNCFPALCRMSSSWEPRLGNGCLACFKRSRRTTSVTWSPATTLHGLHCDTLR